MFIRPIPIIFLAFAASNAMAVNVLTSSLNDDCGKGQVINTTTLYTTDGRDMKVTIQSCGTPPSDSPLTRDIGLEKRQMPSVCSQTCVQSCHFDGSAAPDCTSLISTINSLAGETFIAPPGTRTIFEVGTCEVSFTHGLGVPVEGCFSWMVKIPYQILYTLMIANRARWSPR
ncbi:hypothetical protein JB92DRAFT_2979216 [Gautieria morchelliformis]|nr:hypothetical protein JB92DRAFT_2979216 [Gautieria morchelliformis]